MKYEAGKRYHFLPPEEMEAHEASEKCLCAPIVQYRPKLAPEYLVIQHFSFLGGPGPVMH